MTSHFLSVFQSIGKPEQKKVVRRSLKIAGPLVAALFIEG